MHKSRNRIDELVTRVCARNCSAEDLPVGLRPVAVSRIEGDAVFVEEGWVEFGLHGVDVFGDEVEVEEAVIIKVVEDTVGGLVVCES